MNWFEKLLYHSQNAQLGTGKVNTGVLDSTRDRMTVDKKFNDNMINAGIAGITLPFAVETAVASPLAFAGSLFGGYAGGRTTDAIIKRNSEYDSWADYLSDKTGIPDSYAEYFNPGTITGAATGGGLGKAATTSINTSKAARINKPIVKYNDYMTAKNNAEIAAANEFNAANSTPRILAASDNPGGSYTINGTNVNNFGVRVGNGVYENPNTGVVTRLTTRGAVNGRPQASYVPHAGSRYPQNGGQQIKYISQYMQTPDKFVPYETVVAAPGKFAIAPFPFLSFGGSTYTPPVEEVEVEEKEPIPVIPKGVHGGEAVTRSWGSKAFRKWFEEQIAAGNKGTKQQWPANGHWYTIDYGEGNIQHRNYTPEGYQLSETHTLNQLPKSGPFKRRVARSNNGFDVDSTATRYGDLDVKELPAEFKRGGRINYLLNF